MLIAIRDHATTDLSLSSKVAHFFPEIRYALTDVKGTRDTMGTESRAITFYRAFHTGRNP